MTDRRYALGLLMVVGLVNYIDRICVSILSVPIRTELGLSDTQLGVLTGLAFSLVYTLMAVPIAHLADRGSRLRVIAGCLALWSLMTAGCGLATGFVMLAVLRMGVAVGEAGCTPATQALLSDFYGRDERTRALATWQVVFPLGTLVGFAASGWLQREVGWRMAFVVFGLVGLALVPVVLLTLREPPRGAADGLAAAPRTKLPLAVAVRSLWALRGYRHLLLGGGCMAYAMNASLYWNAQFYSRVFGLPLADLALILALLSGGAGAIGLFGGGWLAGHLARRDPRWQAWLPGIAGLAVAPFMLAQYFSSDATLSLLAGVVPAMLLPSFMAPQAAGAQSLASPDLRAVASGMIVLVAGTLGSALGPFVTGLLSDLLAARLDLGAESLRYAIGFSSLWALVGGAILLAGGAHYARDLTRPQAVGA
jgi:MFS family permease